MSRYINIKPFDDPFYLFEGLNINLKKDKQGGYVSYDPTHNYLVNMCLEDNPTVDADVLPGIEVWSLFKRNRNNVPGAYSRGDGNPLIYAFKGENNWEFESEDDRQAIIRQIKSVMTKYKASHKADVTIIIPSRSYINQMLADIYQQIEPGAKIIKGLLLKMSTDEVYDQLMTPGSDFIIQNFTDLDSKVEMLEVALDKMDVEDDGVFSYHKVKNPFLRNLIQKTLKVCDDPVGKYGDMINGKHVLVIDDTISRGNTIHQAVALINAIYMPLDITVLTLCSRL